MSGIKDIGRNYIEYLRDESRSVGKADSISFPRTELEVVEHLQAVRDRGLPVTVQGARTGITGGAVPRGGHILNLSRMTTYQGMEYLEEKDEFILRVQPGVLLCDLEEAVRSGAPGEGERIRETRGCYFFPPDPTEASASLGGMVSCNASGAKTFFFGPTRKYIDELTVVLYSGEILHLKRGREKARGLGFALSSVSGKTYSGRIPSYTMPGVKSAAGLYAAPDMDLIDLFIGSEGTLGVFTSIGVRIVRALPSIWGVVAFFPDEEKALSFVQALRAVPRGKPVAMEFFNNSALELLRKQKRTNPAFGEVQEIPGEYHTAVYVEFHGRSEEETEEMVFAMADIMAGSGGDEDATWIASSEKELQHLKLFRHAIPEAVNLLIDERRKKEPGLTKLGTDMAVPDSRLREVLALYREGLARHHLESVMFGHIGNNHIHVNILPKSMKEYRIGKSLYLQWADEIVSMGGTVSAEHGIGKLKTAFLEKMYGKKGIEEMKAVIRSFNPGMMLNPGNMVG